MGDVIEEKKQTEGDTPSHPDNNETPISKVDVHQKDDEEEEIEEKQTTTDKTLLENCPLPVQTPRRVNKLRDHNSSIFPVGCMGCREEPPSDHMASPRRFLDPIEARDHAGHMDNTPRKRPSSAKPNNIHRNPLTGVGVDDETRKTYGRRKADGNPLLGEGYETKEVTPSCTRIPPGGYSQGLW